MSGPQQPASRVPSSSSHDLSSGPSSLPNTPRFSRRSIFSSEPKTPRSAFVRMSSRDSMRSPGTKRRDRPTPPTPRKAWSKESKPKDDEPNEYEELPKLPIPPLSDTLAQYLDNIKPIVQDSVYHEAKQIVDKFGMKDGVGEKVMMLLEEKREKVDNWAYDYWLSDMYLNVRLPLPVNSNPAMVFPKRKFSNHSQMLCYTSRLINGFLKFKSKLDRRAIPQDKAKTEPLCMAQYFRVLTSYRYLDISKQLALLVLSLYSHMIIDGSKILSFFVLCLSTISS